MGTVFTNLIGTLAVLVVIAFFVAGSEALSNFTFKSHYWKFDVLAGWKESSTGPTPST